MLFQLRRDDNERGQMIVLFALMLVVMLLIAGIAVDLGELRNDRQTLVNAIDSAALAGGTQMPLDGDLTPKGNAAGSQWTLNQALIKNTMTKNYPSLAYGSKAQYLAGTADWYIEYRCLIGADPTTNLPNISTEIPSVCNPSGALGHSPVAADFSGAGAIRSSICDPTALFNGHYDKCNTVVVKGFATTQYMLAPVVGIQNGSTGTIQSAACNGSCGQPVAKPVDVVLIMDRTASMSAQSIADIQSGANTLLSVFDPTLQRIALGTIGPSLVGKAACPSGSTSPLKSQGSPANQVYGVGQSPGSNVNFFGNPADLTKWIPVGFSGKDADTPAVLFNEAYSTSGTTNTTSTIWKAISCLYSYTLGTNLDTPMAMAQTFLNTYGRPGVKKGIIFETDGAPQAGDGSAHYTCNAANNTATTAKSAGMDVYTIGFGIGSVRCPYPNSSQPSGCSGTTGRNVNESTTWSCIPVANLLQGMASPDLPGQQHFFNAPTSAELVSAFRQAALQLSGTGTHLIDLYPKAIVTGLSPATGAKTGGTVVTITGKYFTGATSVTFGGTAATSFTVNSDTKITATAPAGPANATVDVAITTGGGVSYGSPTASADNYLYGP
jgi:hypothetical protein